jgi:ribokinase
MPTRPSITCVGSTMVDLISYLERLPGQGETVFGRDFAQGFGGKGANQAVMAALLGADVLMVNAVGTDAFGRETIENFRAFGIDVRFIAQLDGTYSGVANILVDPSGDNRIVLGAGANRLISETQVEAAFRASRHPTLVLSQLEIPQSIILRAFQLGKQAGATTVLNPGPAAPVDPRLLALTDWLIPNETEFAVLYASQFERAPENMAADVVRLASALEVAVVVTLGRDGAVMVDPAGTPARHFVAPVVEAVDTTGAGDAFCGGFAYAVAAGLGPTTRFGSPSPSPRTRSPGAELRCRTPAEPTSSASFAVSLRRRHRTPRAGTTRTAGKGWTTWQDDHG